MWRRLKLLWRILRGDGYQITMAYLDVQGDWAKLWNIHNKALHRYEAVAAKRGREPQVVFYEGTHGRDHTKP